MTLLEALTRRRLGGAVLVLAGLVVGVAVLASVLGRDEDAGSGGARPGARRVSVPPLGLAFTQPAGWERTVDGRVIGLRSPDGTTTLTIASPAAGRQDARVKRALERGLRRRLAPARLVGDAPGQLGTRRVRSVEILGGGRGRRVRALGIVDSTPYRTYAVTVFTPARPSRLRLQQTRTILTSVRLTKPVRRRTRR